MPACARKEIIIDGEVGVYHVWTRCVRRSFLCGADELTGRNFDHRRDWIRHFLPRLCGLLPWKPVFMWKSLITDH